MKKILMIVTVVLLAAGVIGGTAWLVVDNLDQREQLSEAKAATLAVTEERNRAQGQVADAQAEVKDLDSEVVALNDTLNECRTLAPVSLELIRAASDGMDAVVATTSQNYSRGMTVMDTISGRIESINVMIEDAGHPDLTSLAHACEDGTGV